MYETVTINDFHDHKFADIGTAPIAIYSDRALISITSAANLVKKDRKHLVRWLLINKIAMFHFTQINDSLTAMYFDDFIEFCIQEKNIADNQNAVVFLNHLLEDMSA